MFTPPPRFWNKKQKYIQITDDIKSNPELLEETKLKNKETLFNNRIACDKKAYFFGYIYMKYIKEYKKHIKTYNQMSKIRFLEDLDTIIKKENKSDAVKKFVKGYYNYMPLFNNNCTMNYLCKYVENSERNCTNYWRKNDNVFDYKRLLSDENFKLNKKLTNDLIPIISKFNKYYSMMSTDIIYMERYGEIDREDITSNVYGSLFESYESKLYSLCSNEEELCNHIVYLYYNKFKNAPKSLIWNIFGEKILNNIKKKSNTLCFPVLDENNGFSYLGKKYSLFEREIDRGDSESA